MSHKENEIEFDRLVGLFKETQSVMHAQAARSVDTALVVRNWLFGWFIVEYQQSGSDRAEYGTKLLKKLSRVLKNKLGRGFSVDSLELMRKFYAAYQQPGFDSQKSETVSRISGSISERVSRNLVKQPEFVTHMTEIWHKLSVKFTLSWSHYVVLLTIKSMEARKFYEIEAQDNSWGIRELKRQISSSLYERLALSRDKEKIRELSEKGQLVNNPKDVLKSPYVLEFLDLQEHSSYSELELETAIIDRIERFLLELGKGFLFEARQKRFSFDDRHFYVDLVFYNRLLRSYVIIDLKIGDLKHQDLGQMQMYVNYFDRHVKTEDEKPTVGILLCLTKSEEMVELTLPEGANIYASEYQLYLPSKEELCQQLEEVQKAWKDREGETS